MKKLLYLLNILIANVVFAQSNPEATEVWEPIPEIIIPGNSTQAPSDAIVLFDKEINDEWVSENGKAIAWEVKDGVLTIKPGSGSIRTKRNFADCQLHIEWRTPEKITGDGQARGNSGIYFQERYEVQVLDSYENPTYSNGQAGAIYKQHSPMVNASLKPGTWQAYDIIYTAPRFNTDSTLKTPAYITVLHNGIIIQNHVDIKGPAVYIGQPVYKKHAFSLPLSLQDHDNPVSYRNIWIREFSKQNLFNGKNLEGWYSYLDSLGKNNDPEKVFKVIDEKIHISGKQLGYLSTIKEYENYYLKVVFKWGVKKYPPRQNAKRDSGILYHFDCDSIDQVWPSSIECQVQEGDCGDFWLVGNTNVETKNQWIKEWGMKHIIRTDNFENEHGAWNTIEIICNGNQIEHYVNGHLVNAGTDANVTKGKILLQSEGAEVIYNSIELIPF